MHAERKPALSSGLKRVLFALTPMAVFAWVCAWIISFAPTLINDEYAAIDYFYRIMKRGETFPTPDDSHKPLSVLLGFFSWASESPLGYEVSMAAFAAVMVVALYLAAREELGPGLSALATIAAAVNPGLMHYGALGSTIMPFCALGFVAVVLALQRESRPRAIWGYSICMLVSGLLRPESWLFGITMVVWWWPGRDRKAWLRLIAAGCIMALGPVIWFGKDLIINGDLFHGLKLAVEVKEVSTSITYSAWQSLSFVPVRIANHISRPIALAGVAGLVLFVRDKGIRQGLSHPFVLLPLLITAYVWFIIYKGVYPVQRYYYFDSLVLLVFASHLSGRVLPKIRLPAKDLFAYAAMFSALFVAAAYAYARPGGSSDLYWMLACAGALAVFFGFLGTWSPGMRARWKPLLLAGVLVFLALFYAAFCLRSYEHKLSALELESKKQRDMKAIAAFLDKSIPPGSGDRIMLPNRRDEQLSWLFRHREIPDSSTFIQAFYLENLKGMHFLRLEPDWIVFFDQDFNFWGPREQYEWLQHQDHTVLRGIRIDLAMEAEIGRVFKVTYPPDYGPRSPLPEIP